MDLLIIITSTIILLLIIFFSWNIFYENYTDLLNSGKNLLITDNNGNMSKYSVDSFTNSIKKAKTDISNLYLTLNSKINSRTLPYDLDNRINNTYNFMKTMLPNDIYELRLYDSSGVSKTINYNDLGIITGETPVTIFNQNSGKYVKATTGTAETSVVAQTITEGALSGTLSQWVIIPI